MNHRIALIGSGMWGANLARVLAHLGVLEMVCDTDPHRAERIATLYGVRATSHTSAVFEDAAITAVVIATPAASHAALAYDALFAGKDVLVEKPMALTVVDGEKLVALSRERNRICMVGHLLHYHPAVEQLKLLLNSGELGRIRYIQSHRLNLGTIRPHENVLWSFAPHDVSLMISLLGMPHTVQCTGAAWRPDGTPDMTISQFHFEEGVSAHIYVSWLHPYKEQRFTVIGEKGMALFDGVTPSLTVYSQMLADSLSPGVIGRNIALSKEEPLERECRAFLESIETRILPVTHAQEGVDVLRVLDACDQSRITGQQIEVSTPAHMFAHA